MIGLPADPVGRTAVEHVRRLLADAPYERLSLIPILVADYVRMGPRIFAEFWALLRDRPEDKMPQVTAPALVLRGEKDPIATRRWTEEAARLLSAGNVVEIPGYGHAAHYSAARQFVETVAPFLRGAALYMLAATISGTFNYYLQSRLAAATGGDQVELTRLFARVDLVTNVLTAAAQGLVSVGSPKG